MNNILTNQSQLNDYLHDFEPLKKEEVLEKFKDFDFNCGVFSFRDKMKRIISMPKNGKSTTIYWTSRGKILMFDKGFKGDFKKICNDFIEKSKSEFILDSVSVDDFLKSKGISEQIN